MAREITANGQLSFLKGTARDQMSGAMSVDMAGTHFMHGVQNIGTSDESFAKGDVGTVGLCMFRNNSTDSQVEIGVTSGQYTILVLPGESSGPVRLNGTAVHAVASPYEAQVEYMIIEE